MAMLPSLTPIQHLEWIPDGHKDSHGNPTGAFSEPIDRKCICWFPLSRRTWQIDPVDPNVMARIDSDLHVLVEDPNIYKKLDRVIVNGLMYQVEGLPTDWGSGLPFQNAAYGMLIFGELHVRRVTSTGVLAGQ